MTRSFGFRGLCLGLVLAAAGCSNPETAKQEYLANGNRLLAEQKVQEAIVEYRNAIRQDPKFGEARRKLAEAYAQASNHEAAFRESMRAADLLPEDSQAQLTAGHYLLLSGRFEDAKTRAEGVLQREPKNADALIMRANAMAGLKDVDGAVRDIEEALQVEQTDGRMFTSLGMLRSLQGKSDEAEAAYKMAVQVNPKSSAAHLAIANFYWAADRLPEAESSLKEALAVEPSNTLANRMLASLYMVTRRARDAEQPLKAALRIEDASSRLALADYYAMMERPNDAIPILKELAAGASTYGEATIRLAQLAYGSAGHDEGRRVLDELVTKEPRNVRALTLKSRWQLEAKDGEGAVATAHAATEAEAGSAPAHFALASAQTFTGNREAAIKSLTEALRLNPRMVSAQLLLSRLHLQTGNAPAAAAAADQAKLEQPSNPEVQVAVARSHLIQKNIARAEPEVRQLLQWYPQHAASHSLHGMLLLAKDDFGGARAAFSRAVGFDANSSEALEGLLALDIRSRTVPAAIERIEQTFAKSPNNPAVMLIAARTYLAARQMNKAEQALRKVIDLAPHDLTAYMMLGQIYIAQQRLDLALAEFEAAAKRQPNQVGASTMAAIILDLQHKRSEARQRYEGIVADHPRAPVAANNLAWIYAEDGGNLDVALQLAQAAKAQMPTVAEVNDTLGWVYYKKDLPLLAIPPLEESVAKDAGNAAYHFHLGLAYAKAGQHDKARASLEKALQISPQFDGADVARRSLADLRD